VGVSEKFQQMVKEYHVFYEVLPYHVLIEEGHGSPHATKRIIQGGFDVDVHGISNKNELQLPPPGEYALGYGQLKKIADTVQHDAGDCSIEVIPFPEAVFSEAREQFRPEARLRIRISHRRGIDQPVGLPEQHALEEIEKQLQGLGIRRR
jgi:hypothetical protein